MASAQRHGAGRQVSIDLTSMETPVAVVSSCVCALRGLGVYQQPVEMQTASGLAL